MSYYKDIKFTLKVVINRQNTKVLFAEADSDCADVLLSFLSLPLGTIVRLLKNHYGDETPVIGSLTTLSNGLSDLDVANFWNEGRKRMLLNPVSSFDVNDTDRATKYFCCEDWDCVFSKKTNMSMYYGIARCDCRKPLIREVPMRNASRNDGGGDDDGVFVVRGTTFIMSDDLLIMPNAAGSVIQILGDLGITDMDWGEMKDVTFGFNEIMDLLKGSLLSQTPLTDIILNKGQITFATPTEPGILLPKVEKKETRDSDTITVKVIIQKSTNRLLFAQVEEDFVDVLFSLLTIPLGGVECLLDGNTCLKNIDNLYKSVKDLSNDDKYLDADKALYSLIDPNLPHGYISDNQILPLQEDTHDGPRKIYYYRGSGPHDDFMSLSHDMGGSCIKVTSPKFKKGQNSYVKGPRIYVVNDDLSVKPSCMTSYLSNLNRLKIPISDVTELVLHVGLKETLSILKASLASKSALSNGLSHLLKKKPKQEH